MRSLHFFLATGAYSGLFPFSPGTFGSFAALLVWIVLGGDILTKLIAIVLLTAVSLISVKDLLSRTSDLDPQFIVIDEWVGMWIALLPISTAISYPYYPLLIAFTAFRLFDILKPWPVSQCENLPGAWGVMMDDVAAGAFAALFYLLL